MGTCVHNKQATTLHTWAELTLIFLSIHLQEGDALRILRLRASRLEMHPHAAVWRQCTGCHERKFRRSDLQL